MKSDKTRERQVKRPRRAPLNDPFMWSILSPKSTGPPFVYGLPVFWPWKAISATRLKVARSHKTRWADLILVGVSPDVRVVGRRGTRLASELALIRQWIDLIRDVRQSITYR